MPEPPGIVVYIGARLEGVRLTSLFVLRSVEPPIDTIVGRTVAGIQRLGKRMVIGFRGCALGRSEDVRRGSIAQSVACLRVPTCSSPRSGDRFAIASGCQEAAVHR